MPRNDYAAGVPVEFTYRCSGSAATAAPTAAVLDETGAVHSTLTVGAGIELKHGRTFMITFTPDEIGTWIVNVTDSNNGDASSTFGVATRSMAWVVDQLESLSVAMTVLVDAVAELDSGGGAHIG